MLNFRQFKGETSINFLIDDKKNVTVILGDNTYGKTTILQAFNWCFYNTVNLPNKENLLNYEVAESLFDDERATVEVEIQLIHNSVCYILNRSQDYIKKGPDAHPLQPRHIVSYKKPDGQTVNIKDSKSQNVINSILPQDLSSYFFFDTERVNQISQRSDLAESVKGLLGLSVLDNAIKHLGGRTSKRTVIGRFYGEMDVEGDRQASELLEKIEDEKSRREIIKTQIENTTSEIKIYEDHKEQLDTVLRDNQETTELQRKKEDNEKRIKMAEDEQEETRKLILDEFDRTSIHFFTEPLVKQAVDFLHEVKLDDKGIKDLTRITLEDLLKREICVCGTALSEGSAEWDRILEEMKYVPPESIGNLVRAYRETMYQYCRDRDASFTSMKDRFERLRRSKSYVRDWIDENDEIMERISGKENMDKYVEQLKDVKSRIKDLSAKKEKLIRDDESLKGSIERHQKAYDGLITSSQKNKDNMIYIDYAEEIREWLETTYTEKETAIRDGLEEKVNSIFNQMYSGTRRVSIDNKYNVKLFSALTDDKDIESGESEGLNRVKNFAFIAGLVAMAKDKIVSTPGEGEEDFDLASEPYPLVMDAPFSNADEKHTANISKVLPEVADQIIMFVMNKDWKYADPIISDKVGRRYMLIKHSEHYTELKEG